jgi:hypothetical protein
MKTSSVFAATLLLFSIPCVACAKERGTVVDICERGDLYARFYIYKVETETRHRRNTTTNRLPPGSQ